MSICQSQNKHTEAQFLLDEVSAKAKDYESISLEFKYVLENTEENIKQETRGDVTLKGDKSSCFRACSRALSFSFSTDFTKSTGVLVLDNFARLTGVLVLGISAFVERGGGPEDDGDEGVDDGDLSLISPSSNPDSSETLFMSSSLIQDIRSSSSLR